MMRRPYIFQSRTVVTQPLHGKTLNRGHATWITNVAQLTYSAFSESLAVFNQRQIRKIAYASPFALAGSGRQAKPLRGHWLLGSSGRPFTSICSERTDAPHRGSWPLSAARRRDAVVTQTSARLLTACARQLISKISRRTRQSASLQPSSGAQTRQAPQILSTNTMQEMTIRKPILTQIEFPITEPIVTFVHPSHTPVDISR